MNNMSKRYTAMAASCALIMSTFCSCGDNSTSSSGNYKKDEHRNNNSIVSEAPQTADEEYVPEFTDSPRPSYPSDNEEYKE